jgi:NAD+ synthase
MTNIEKCREKIVSFIRDYLNGSGHRTGVVGVSGGVDSSLVFFLTCEAIGAENTVGALLPHADSSPVFTDRARKIVAMKGGDLRYFDITETVNSFQKLSSTADSRRIGNIMARVRMTALFDIAAESEGLVIGTGNKTEILLGYFTVFGDGACALEPLGDLYKSEVWEMARLLGIPEEIVVQPPTADLWEGQTDEGELGISYDTADRILSLLVERELSIEQITDIGFKRKDVERVVMLVKNSEFKRRMPPFPELRPAPG